MASPDLTAMKKFLLLSSAIVAAGPALAADLPAKAPPMAAPVPYTWTGCHVGGHIGAGWDHTTYSDPGTLAPPIFGGPPVLTQNFAGPGQAFSANGQAAFSRRRPGRLRLSVRQPLGDRDRRRRLLDQSRQCHQRSVLRRQERQPGRILGPHRRDRDPHGRVGYAWDKVLFYGKGGGAYAHDKYAQNNSFGINNDIFGCDNGVVGAPLSAVIRPAALTGGDGPPASASNGRSPQTGRR